MQLKAELVAADGSVADCAAAWSVDDARVASITPAGVLTGGITGYVTVTAACQGRTAQLETKTSTTCPYKLIIVAYDSEVRSEFGVAATIEFLDGQRAGDRLPIEGVFTNGIAGIEWPTKIRVTAESFRTREFVLSEATGQRRNPTSPLFDYAIPMTFEADASTDTHVRTMSATDMEYAHPFSVKAPGTVQVRTWWSVDYNDGLAVQLWCGGDLMREVSQRFGSAGSGFSHDVPTANACEVRLRQLKRDAATRYRVAIRYPH